MAPGEAGKEALTGQDAPQPCLEWDIGVLQMWLWLQWVSHPQLSQSSLGWRMEPAGSQDSYRLFAGGGVISAPGVCLWVRCSDPLSILTVTAGETTLLCFHPKDFHKARKGTQASGHLISP